MFIDYCACDSPNRGRHIRRVFRFVYLLILTYSLTYLLTYLLTYYAFVTVIAVIGTRSSAIAETAGVTIRSVTAVNRLTVT